MCVCELPNMYSCATWLSDKCAAKNSQNKTDSNSGEKQSYLTVLEAVDHLLVPAVLLTVPVPLINVMN